MIHEGATSGGSDELTVEQKAARFAKLNAFLAAKKLLTTSADGQVAVTTDGFGEILSLSVDPAALTGDRAVGLGRTIVATVGEARDRAQRLRAAGRAKMFPGMPEVGP